MSLRHTTLMRPALQCAVFCSWFFVDFHAQFIQHNRTRPKLNIYSAPATVTYHVIGSPRSLDKTKRPITIVYISWFRSGAWVYFITFDRSEVSSLRGPSERLVVLPLFLSKVLPFRSQNRFVWGFSRKGWVAKLEVYAIAWMVLCCIKEQLPTFNVSLFRSFEDWGQYCDIRNKDGFRPSASTKTRSFLASNRRVNSEKQTCGQPSPLWLSSFLFTEFLPGACITDNFGRTLVQHAPILARRLFSVSALSPATRGRSPQDSFGSRWAWNAACSVVMEQHINVRRRRITPTWFIRIITARSRTSIWAAIVTSWWGRYKISPKPHAPAVPWAPCWAQSRMELKQMW